MKALQGEGELISQIRSELAKAAEFCFGMALIKRSGLDLIRSSIERCLKNGGHGRVLFGVDLPTEPAAVEILREIEAAYRQNFKLRRFQSGKTFFHPKISIFSRRAGTTIALIGSSNLTEGGLSTNYETNVLLDDQSVVERFIDYFDEHFEGAHARLVDGNWLDQYKRIWSERQKVERRQRKLRNKARKLGKRPSNAPIRLKNHVFAFTGRIADWPRRRLYPYIEKHGGKIAKKAGSMANAECLVHGEIMGGKKSTKKLLRANDRRRPIPIITEEEFFKIAKIGIRK